MAARFALLACYAALSFASGALFAQTYPNQPLRMIVGYPPGGGSDVVARLVAQGLGEALAQQVVVDNRPGAATMISVGIAAKANADGYTILFVTSSFVINPSLYRKVAYDPKKDFAPVSLVAATPYVLVVNPAGQVNSVNDLVTLAKSKPGQLDYASGGSGSTGHLAAELFKSMAGVDIQHIPYQGFGPVITDLLGGRVLMSFVSLPGVQAHMRSGKLKALAATTARRLQSFPELPTMAESGFRGYEVEQWFGIVVPAGTRSEIIRKLNASIAAYLQTPDAKKRFSSAGAETLHKGPESFGAYIKEEQVKWAKVISVSGARVD